MPTIKFQAAISCLMEQDPTLYDPDISSEALTDEQFQTLCASLANNKIIKLLKIRHKAVKLSDASIEIFANMLATHTTLEIVDLTLCRISEQGIACLRNAAQANSILKKIFVTINKKISILRRIKNRLKKMSLL